MRKILALLIILLLFISPAWHTSKIDTVLKGGWLKEINGIKVLYISGTHYEMGYQHGYLLRNETRENLRAFLNNTHYSYEKLLEIWNITKNFIPKEYIEELRGLADGAGIKFEDVGGSGPNNYTSIQAAIDNASDGDTIFVYSGTYEEQVIVNKSLIIKGENNTATLIKGGFML